MPPPGQSQTGAPPQVTRVSAALTERVSPTGFLGDAGPERTARPAREQHRAQRGLAVLRDALDRAAQRLGELRRMRHQRLVELEVGPLLAGRRHHQQPQTGPGVRRAKDLDDRQRIADVGPAPAAAGFGDAEVAPGRRLRAADADAARRHVEHLPRLVLGEDARDVIVDDDHLVDVRRPLAGEHADRRRAAADPHQPLARSRRRRAGGRPARRARRRRRSSPPPPRDCRARAATRRCAVPPSSSHR